jgi:hypothetical protein
MSNHLAVATVTGALQHVLAGAAAVVPGATVTARRPDSAAAHAASINIFLYQAVPNAAYRNADLPTRRADGLLTHRPQAALTLHYLLTFFGDDTRFEPQRLLGASVRKLHAQPILTKQDIVNVTKTNSALTGSNLDAQVDLVRFTPLGLSLEELSKLWSVFVQSPYALSVAYQAGAILIETDEAPAGALPVQTRNVYVKPFRQPVVEKVVSQPDESSPIVAGGTMLIRGQQLRGDSTLVLLGGVERNPISVSDTEISVIVPPDLRAGIQPLQVVHKIRMGAGADHRGFESNVMPFVLAPTAMQTVSNITSAVENGVTLFSAKVTITFTPAVAKTQFVKLMLNEADAPNDRPPHDYTFLAPKDNGIVNVNQTETANIAFAVSRVRGGVYFLRVQVDGAESPLAVDTNPNSPTFNQYTGPKVTIQ